MTAVRYTRYTLHVPGVAPPGEHVPPERLEQQTDGSEWIDDWSGIAPPPGRDPAALDYRHPEAVALLRSLGVGWQELDGGETLVFWLAEDVTREPQAARALRQLGALGRLEAADEPPGWEDAWKAFHQPQVAGRLYVRPPWSPPSDDLIDLVIETGMAFGTGAHPTTRQCLEELQLLPPGPLLDLGCGSGVVSLAALRLGFGPVWGVDIDPVAVQAAEDNAGLNDLPATFWVADATDPGASLPDADTVVANIALAPILRLAARFAGGGGAEPRAHRPSRLLLAGLLVTQRVVVLTAFAGYRLASARDDGEWLLLRLEAA